MIRPRVSIAVLMGLVGVIALGFGALRNATLSWAGLMVMLTLALLGLAVLGIIYRRGAKRAFWIGFALFGSVYFWLAHETLLEANYPPPVSGQPTRQHPLLTTIILERAKPFLGPERGAQFYDSVLDLLLTNPKDRAIHRALGERIPFSFGQQTPLESALKHIQAATIDNRDLPNGIPMYVDPAGLFEAQKSLQSPVQLTLQGVPLRMSLRLLLKQIELAYTVKDGLMTIHFIGAKDSEFNDAFERIGHCLFALLFGFAGGVAGVLFCATQKTLVPPVQQTTP